MTPEQIAASNTEYAHQCAYFCWMQQNLPNILCFAIANGEKREKITAARLKAAGVKAGVPDIFLPEPIAYKHGLYIELKVGKNTTSTEQRKWIKELIARNYKCVVCYSWIEAVQATKTYLEMK